MTKKTQNGQRRSLLTGASVLAAAAAAMSGAPAFAQDADDEEAIVVTGTRIPQANLYTTSPVTQVTGEDIRTAGVTRVEDLTNQLPQIFAGQGSNVSNGATGTATVNLRGLGAARTLVLIDGRRMGYGSPNATAADLNQIPGQLVERVEVLTGGASAVYGSDAVAGVVNFIMRDNFEGVRFDAQYGFYQHNNDSDDGFIREVIAARAATNPSQFQLPEDDQLGGYGKEVTAIFGVSSPDQRGNITAYVGYRTNDAILQRDYDYSACALGPASTAAVTGVPAGAAHWTCGGSGTSAGGQFNDFTPPNAVACAGAGGVPPCTSNYTINGLGGFRRFNNALDQYNFGPLNYYQRPDERYTLGAFAHYELNDRVEAYAQAMFTDYRSLGQIAPSGDFFNTGTINCDNPLLSAQQQDLLCNGFVFDSTGAIVGPIAARVVADTDGGTAGNQGLAPFYIGRRNVEGGGRQDDLNYESYRTVLGFRGPLTDSWDYDVSGQYSRVKLSRVYRNDFSVTRLTRALDVVNNGPDGILGNADDAPICRSVLDGTDPNCEPYDIFSGAGPSDDALTYLQVPLIQVGETTQQVVMANVTGELGWTSPWAESPLAAAFGLEYRRDTLATDVDTSFSSGDGAGQGGPTLPLSGEVDVFEVYGEARIPIVEGAAMADLLALDLAYRYSSYSTGIETDTYKIGGEWAPSDDIRFRASYQRAVRAANVIELFSSQGFGLFDMDDDPCDANDPALDGFNLAGNCIGVLPYQVTGPQSTGGGLNSPAGQYNGLFGGNPNLGPESADTMTIGLVFTPDFIPGFTLSIDYFDIEVTELVSTTGAVNTLTDCFVNGTTASCNRITRNPGTGQLWVGAGVVEDLNTNIGGLQTTGFDINVNYNMDVGDMGGLNFNLVGTLLEELITDPGAASGRAPYDCVGAFGAALCGTPNPEWRHRFRVTWETPWDMDLSATWRYFGEVERLAASGLPVTGVANSLDAHFDAEHYLDLSGNWQIMENTRLRFGVNNVLDNDPPISANVGAGFGNGNTYPQVYDSLGRWVFAGVTVDF